MWLACLLLSVLCLVLSAVVSLAINKFSIVKKQKFNLFNALFAGVFLAAAVIFFPVHRVMTAGGVLGVWHAILLSAFNSMQIFAMGCEFAVVTDSMSYCPEWLNFTYQTWTAMLFVLAPIFTFGFVLSLFKNLSAYIGYFSIFFKDAYVFSEINDKSLVLASDIKKNHPRAAIVFTDVFDANEEISFELIESAKQLGAVCFKRDILAIDFNLHSSNKIISFFAIGRDEGENLNQSLKLIEAYKGRKNTHVYIFSTKVESELALTSIDKGEIKVRRINEVQSLVNRVLYERGEIIFESARVGESGDKEISAVVVGMGSHGTEMVKALTWFGQMDGYRLKIDAFDRDPLAEERFVALAPELMSEKYGEDYNSCGKLIARLVKYHCDILEMDIPPKFIPLIEKSKE